MKDCSTCYCRFNIASDQSPSPDVIRDLEKKTNAFKKSTSLVRRNRLCKDNMHNAYRLLKTIILKCKEFKFLDGRTEAVSLLASEVDFFKAVFSKAQKGDVTTM